MSSKRPAPSRGPSGALRGAPASQRPSAGPASQRSSAASSTASASASGTASPVAPATRPPCRAAMQECLIQAQSSREATADRYDAVAAAIRSKLSAFEGEAHRRAAAHPQMTAALQSLPGKYSEKGTDPSNMRLPLTDDVRKLSLLRGHAQESLVAALQTSLSFNTTHANLLKEDLNAQILEDGSLSSLRVRLTRARERSRRAVERERAALESLPGRSDNARARRSALDGAFESLLSSLHSLESEASQLEGAPSSADAGVPSSVVLLQARVLRSRLQGLSSLEKEVSLLLPAPPPPVEEAEGSGESLATMSTRSQLAELMLGRSQLEDRLEAVESTLSGRQATPAPPGALEAQCRELLFCGDQAALLQSSLQGLLSSAALILPGVAASSASSSSSSGPSPASLEASILGARRSLASLRAELSSLESRIAGYRSSVSRLLVCAARARAATS